MKLNRKHGQQGMGDAQAKLEPRRTDQREKTTKTNNQTCRPRNKLRQDEKKTETKNAPKLNTFSFCDSNTDSNVASGAASEPYVYV